MLEPVDLAGVEGVVQQDGVGAAVGVGQDAVEGLQGGSGGVKKVEDWIHGEVISGIQKVGGMKNP